MKIGRNYPCPCGSGKKYKHCCIRKDIDFRWWEDTVEQYSNKQIIKMLNSMGIKTSVESFKQKVKNFDSADELSEDWFQKYNVKYQGFEEDFPWFAAMVLWRRLVPNKICEEQIGEMIEKGYDLIYEENKKIEGCKQWLKVWNTLEPRFRSSPYKDIFSWEEHYQGGENLVEYIIDLIGELRYASSKNKKYHRKRIEICQSLLEIFPESDPELKKYIRVSEAKTYFELDDIEKGENKFQSLNKDHPNWLLGYVGWGDMYNPEMDGLNNPQKARKIYKQGLFKFDEFEGDDSVRDVLNERLHNLEDKFF